MANDGDVQVVIHLIGTVINCDERRRLVIKTIRTFRNFLVVSRSPFEILANRLEVDEFVMDER